MSLLFIDGMDHYTAAQMGQKWVGGSNLGWTNNIGRFGGGGTSIGANAGPKTATQNFPAAGTLIAGFGMKIGTAFPASAQPFYILLNSGTKLASLRLTPSGQIQVASFNPSSGSFGAWVAQGTSTLTLSLGLWYFIEFKVVLTTSTTSNQCVVNVNNDNWLNLVGVQTEYSGTTANQCQLTGTDLPAWTWDDFYLCDNAGSQCNDILGDSRIETLYPDGAGNYSQFLLTGAATRWQAVSEATADDDSSFISDDTVGHINTFTFGNPAGTVTSVFGLQSVLRARKDNAGTRAAARVIRISGTDYASSSIALGTDYTFYRDILELNPNTTIAFTSSDINALEAGVKVAS